MIFGRQRKKRPPSNSIGRETLFSALFTAIESSPKKISLQETAYQRTNAELARQVLTLAGYLDSISVKAGDNVVVFCENSNHWLPVSLAIQAIGAVECPQQPLTGKPGEDYLKRIKPKLIFAGDESIRDTIPKLRKVPVILMHSAGGDTLTLPKIWMDFDCPQAEGFRALNEKVSPSATAMIIRTSGTTGRPKLVELSHTNLLHSVESIPAVIDLAVNDSVLSILPPWHLYARLVEYTALYKQATICYGSLASMAADLKRFRPTVFPSFPEIWEVVYHQIVDKAQSSHIGRLLFVMTAISKLYFRSFDWIKKSKRLGPMLLSVLIIPVLFFPHRLFDLIAYRFIRRAAVGPLKAAIIADAPLPYYIDVFLRAIGLSVLEGYGSTEQTVTAIRRRKKNTAGTAGSPLPGVRVHIIDDAGSELPQGKVGEIVVCGPNVFRGYFDDDYVRRSISIAGDKCFRTGDAGKLNGAGELVVRGRMLNRFRLKSGLMVYPEQIESALRASRYIDRVAAFGDGSDHITAVIVPQYADLLVQFPEKQFGLKEIPAFNFDFPVEFCDQIAGDKEIRAFLELKAKAALERSRLPESYYPTLKIAWRPFRLGEELTQTLKVRREKVAGMYGPF